VKTDMTQLAVFITGATRGVGLAIAKRYAQQGAKVAIVGKTQQPHPKLPGTLATAKAEILAAGASEVRTYACDVRDLAALQAAIDDAAQTFGVIDILVNNASALYLLDLHELTESKYNLMHDIIVRASLFAAKYARPYLNKSQAPHIIQLAPKPQLLGKWFDKHAAYTLCKFAAGMLVVGLASELAADKIAVNAVWPKTLLATAAVQNLLGGDKAIPYSRKPEVVADAIALLTAMSEPPTGEFFLDEEILRNHHVDLSAYAMVPGNQLITDLYVED
jgi:citronellol/citronellal dehydrogenase